MGVRGVDPSVQHAYPLRAQANKEVGPFIVSGSAFTKYYGIATGVARRFAAEAQDGIFIVDLEHDEGQAVTSNRNGSARMNEDGAAT